MGERGRQLASIAEREDVKLIRRSVGLVNI